MERNNLSPWSQVVLRSKILNTDKSVETHIDEESAAEILSAVLHATKSERSRDKPIDYSKWDNIVASDDEEQQDTGVCNDSASFLKCVRCKNDFLPWPWELDGCSHLCDPCHEDLGC